MDAVHPATAASRIVLPEVTLSNFWLRQDLRGGTFEGPDGAGLTWDLVGFPAGWVQFREMDRHFWPLREGFYFPGKFREKQRVSLLGLKSSKTRNMFEFGYFGVSNKYPLRTVGGLSRLERERDILVAS